MSAGGDQIILMCAPGAMEWPRRSVTGRLGLAGDRELDLNLKSAACRKSATKLSHQDRLPRDAAASRWIRASALGGLMAFALLAIGRPASAAVAAIQNNYVT